MQVNRTLTSLNLRGNTLGTEGARVVMDALKVAALAGVLRSIHSLSECMQANCALTSLYLRFNNLGAEGTSMICEALKVRDIAACMQ